MGGINETAKNEEFKRKNSNCVYGADGNPKQLANCQHIECMALKEKKIL